MSNTKASALIAWLKARVGSGYVYGTTGQTCTEKLLRSKQAQYGTSMGAGYYQRSGDFTKGLCARWLGKWVTDCSGLIKRARQQLGGPYKDVSAQGTYNQCSKRGNIKDMPMVPGCAVFMYSAKKKRMGHVGMYIGNGEVIEARGVLYGVVKTKFKNRGWQYYGLLDWLELDLPKDGDYTAPTAPTDDDGGDATNPKPDDEVDLKQLPYLNYGDCGQYVSFMQSLLAAQGYKLPKSMKAGAKYGYDGLWKATLGPNFCETEKVVRAFQKAHALEVDGVCGPKTWAVLLGTTAK